VAAHSRSAKPAASCWHLTSLPHLQDELKSGVRTQSWVMVIKESYTEGSLLTCIQGTRASGHALSSASVILFVSQRKRDVTTAQKEHEITTLPPIYLQVLPE